MKINSILERERFLRLNIKGAGSYALVTFDNQTQPIWITRYPDWNEDGAWFLEAPCQLVRHKFLDESDAAIEAFVREQYPEQGVADGTAYVKSMLKDGWLYEIESPQTSPFLPDKLEDLTLVSEKFCLEWMLEKTKNP